MEHCSSQARLGSHGVGYTSHRLGTRVVPRTEVLLCLSRHDLRSGRLLQSTPGLRLGYTADGGGQVDVGRKEGWVGAHGVDGGYGEQTADHGEQDMNGDHGGEFWLGGCAVWWSRNGSSCRVSEG
jgi:hypothetical protein